MLLDLLDKPVQPEDVQQKRSHPEEHYRNSCILWKTKLATSRSTSDNNIIQQGNFWAILEMIDKRDDTLREHLDTGRKNAQYTPRIILNEVIDVVTEYIRKDHTQSFEDEIALFSTMADEVTNPHGNQILSVCSRMLADCKVKQFFFDLYTLRGQWGKL